MGAICDGCRKAAMYVVKIGKMTVCEECTDKAWSEMRYVKWMAEVDRACIALSSVSVHDLTDQPFMDSFMDGIEPAEMAEIALEDNGWPG